MTEELEKEEPENRGYVVEMHTYWSRSFLIGLLLFLAFLNFVQVRVVMGVMWIYIGGLWMYIFYLQDSRMSLLKDHSAFLKTLIDNIKDTQKELEDWKKEIDNKKV